jgi:hypothetical protein
MFRITTCIIFILLFFSFPTTKVNAQGSSQAMSFITPFEKNDNYSATYFEVMDHYERLAKSYEELGLFAFGSTDSGYPLHMVVLSSDGDFDPESIRQKGKGVLMVMNGIHPGESCGVDASMMLARDYLDEASKKVLLEKVVVVIIPVYNIGGSLNRRPNTRANQNGPEMQGFRGNAKNLDLNRDFVKADTRNARTFNQIFQYWKPDVFIDTHTSNGADYPYTMTLVETQHNKLETPLALYFKGQMLPRLYADMERSGWEMCPYVNVRNTPDDGILGFLDLPRYSSGYAALFNCLSFMSETHMLKPFRDRVRSTYSFIDASIQVLHDDLNEIREAREKAIEATIKRKVFPLNWVPAYEKAETFRFKGYTAKYKTSDVTGLERLYYDRELPWEKDIPYLNNYKPSFTVEKPIAYIIPQAYQDVIERLRWNGVELKQLASNQKLFVEMYRIRDYESRNRPYENHYLHTEVDVEVFQQEYTFQKGDFVVFVNQPANHYIVHTLEPQAPDSYFAWNFFDGILGRKEYFSPYVFDDIAAAFLKEHPEVREELEKKRAEDPEFAKSAWAQLDFVYRKTSYYEPSHNLYPVARLEAEQKMDLE